MALIDVFIPNYQHGQFLRASALSVLTQETKDVRLLIIDNASTDNSVEVARRLAREDSRVEVVENEVNIGRVPSINRGFDWAQSKYVMVLCADDYLTPGALTRAVEILEQNRDLAFAYGPGIDVPEGEAARFPKDSTDAPWQVSSGTHYIRERCDWPPQDVGFPLVRTKVQKRAGHFRAEVRYADDLELMLRLASFGDVAWTGTIQGVRRQHGANESSAYWNDMELWLSVIDGALESFFSHEGRLVPGAADLRKLAKKNLGAAAYWSAVSHFVRGYPRQSAKLFKFAFAASAQMAILPPLGHLSRRSGVLDRMKRIIAERAA